MNSGFASTQERFFIAIIALALAFGLAGCGGGGSPTEPALPSLSGASIDGRVVGGGASSARDASGPRTFASSVTSTDGMSGVKVTVRGTGLSATTDAEGKFGFDSVPAGDRVLVFEHSGEAADLPLPGVRADERIGMVVALSGSQVQVQTMTRSSSSAAALAPSIALEKGTNGFDADLPPGPSIPVGDAVTWEYVVTNDGDDTLVNISVTDDQGEVVSCPDDSLEPGESMTCTATGFAQLGQYANLGTATGDDSTGAPFSDSDPSHYLGLGPSIDLEKSTNGADADLPPGPTIPVGDPVTWDYVVTNDGGVDLQNLSVEDDQGVIVSCPGTTLAVGASMTCTATGVAQPGQYANLGTATAESAAGEVVSDDDPSHYFGSDLVVELTVEIQPGSWNTNWTRSAGTVSALVRGTGLEAIDLDTFELFENEAFAVVLPSSPPRLTGNHVRARFAKTEAFEMLDSPQPGEVRTVTVRFIADGLVVELQDEIRIVGSAK